MRCALQYVASKFAVKVLRLLVECPGLTASQLASIVWKTDTGRYALNAGIALHRLQKHGLVRSKFSSRFWEKGSTFPRKRWYVTDKGFTVHEFYQRQDRNSPYADGTSRTRC